MKHDDDWFFRFANRDKATQSNVIDDAFLIRCRQNVEDKQYDLWYLSAIDKYIYCTDCELIDLAYEQTTNIAYALFSDDNHIYRYDNLDSEGFVDSQNRILLTKELATMKIATFHSEVITSVSNEVNKIYLDYSDDISNGEVKWEMSIWGSFGGSAYDKETWNGNPGKGFSDFEQYNNVIFGDTLFDESQMIFQNVSKNKDMLDIVDIDEVDGCYYGLFKNIIGETESYTVFRVSP